MEMHERIRYLRKEILKLTQQEFSDSLKISRSNMGNIEIGRIAVTDRVIYDICEKFNVNEEWLRAGSGDIFIELSVDEQIAEFIAHVLKDKEESFKKRYISMLSKLDEDGWEALEQVAEMLCKMKKD